MFTQLVKQVESIVLVSGLGRCYQCRYVPLTHVATLRGRGALHPVSGANPLARIILGV